MTAPLSPQTQRMSPSGGAGDDLQVHAVLLVLAGVERPVRGDPVDRVSVPSFAQVGGAGVLGIGDAP